HGPVVTRWEGTPLEERLTRVRHVPIPYSSQDLRARPGDVRRAPGGYRAARSWGGGAASTGPLPLGGWQGPVGPSPPRPGHDHRTPTTNRPPPIATMKDLECTSTRTPPPTPLRPAPTPTRPGRRCVTSRRWPRWRSSPLPACT